MKILLLICSIISLSACTVITPENKTVVNTLKETFEFSAIRKEEAMNNSLDFIKRINSKHTKSNFLIEYNTDESQFIDEFVIKIKKLGVNKLRYNLKVINKTSSDEIKITATYYQLEDKNCGATSFSNINNYAFGCALEFNRKLSLTKPVKGQ
ncbi:hypothetical protein [Vibrio genomosp. F6]|uniref:ATPase n=1 Tax=Vibrio genomosp. F6 str. FF-238 TaxID=1191298 RepID=A0A1E5D7E4_9VIBR|nr:hypothetical protein [Vibrio genomosp. F6]OEE79569.1 hypothetical protein A130_11005 [Vibrio genomosp. F6 str. FF-238]